MLENRKINSPITLLIHISSYSKIDYGFFRNN